MARRRRPHLRHHPPRPTTGSSAAPASPEPSTGRWPDDSPSRPAPTAHPTSVEIGYTWLGGVGPAHRHQRRGQAADTGHTPSTRWAVPPRRRSTPTCATTQSRRPSRPWAPASRAWSGPSGSAPTHGPRLGPLLDRRRQVARRPRPTSTAASASQATARSDIGTQAVRAGPCGLGVAQARSASATRADSGRDELVEPRGRVGTERGPRRGGQPIGRCLDALAQRSSQRRSARRRRPARDRQVGRRPRPTASSVQPRARSCDVAGSTAPTGGEQHVRPRSPSSPASTSATTCPSPRCSRSTVQRQPELLVEERRGRRRDDHAAASGRPSIGQRPRGRGRQLGRPRRSPGRRRPSPSSRRSTAVDRRAAGSPARPSGEANTRRRAAPARTIGGAKL